MNNILNGASVGYKEAMRSLAIGPQADALKRTPFDSKPRIASCVRHRRVSAHSRYLWSDALFNVLSGHFREVRFHLRIVNHGAGAMSGGADQEPLAVAPVDQSGTSARSDAARSILPRAVSRAEGGTASRDT